MFAPRLAFGTSLPAAKNGGDLTFAMKSGRLVSDDGVVWPIGEEALQAADGRNLARVAGSVAYWFAWDGHLGEGADLYGE